MDPTAPQEEPLLRNGMIRCPWCEKWDREEAFIELQTPPNYPDQCGVVLKHRCSDQGARHGGRIFSVRSYQRPAESLPSGDAALLPMREI